MYVIGFKLAAFGRKIPLNRRILTLLLEALTEVNVAIFQEYGSSVPGLYESGIRYRRESIGQEDWCDIVELLRLGFGDCEDLSCYRAAELRARHGELGAKPFVKGPRRLPGGVMMYHIQVERADGRIEDPSLVLGMGSARDRAPAEYRIRRHDIPPLVRAPGLPFTPAHSQMLNSKILQAIPKPMLPPHLQAQTSWAA